MLSDWEKRNKHAEAIMNIIQIQVDADQKEHNGGTSAENETSSTDTPCSQDKSFGPKTTEMPDLTEYTSDKMRDFIDIGSLPKHLKDKAWQMLEKRVNAFGFDG